MADFARTRLLLPRLWHIGQSATANCQSRRKWTTDLWQSREKQDGKGWQFAQWLRDHWHIAAITARYAKELQVEL
jgi:hypothetical protein